MSQFPLLFVDSIFKWDTHVEVQVRVCFFHYVCATGHVEMPLQRNLHHEHAILSRCTYNVSRDMRFPTMWYVRPAKAQTSLRLCAVCSELLLVA